MLLGPGEPAAGPWRVEPIDWVTDTFAAAHMGIAGGPERRPFVVAVDGRSGSGATTLAEKLSGHVPGSIVVHADEITSHDRLREWADHVREAVLEPLHRGEAVDYRPPGGDGHRVSIRVPRGCPAVFIEGVGAARRELMPWIDAVVWVQSDLSAGHVDTGREDGGQAGRDSRDGSLAQEESFLAEQQPWERADVIVAGDGDVLAHDAATEIVVAPPFGD